MNKFFIVGTGVFFLYFKAQSALYNGNGDTSFGGAIGTGSLSLTDNGSIVTGTITRGGSSFADILVIFIDSKTGGFSTTSGLTDSSGRLTRAISGISGNGDRAIADFANGFAADYAIALRPRSVADSDQLFQLVNNGAHTALGSVNLNPLSTQESSTYTFSFNLADIGLTPGGGVSFKFESTYLGETGFRSLESFESLSGTTGWDSVSFGNYDTYTLAPVPEMTNASLAIFGACALIHAIFRQVRRTFKRTCEKS
jgi:hypothetical protein